MVKYSIYFLVVLWAVCIVSLTALTDKEKAYVRNKFPEVYNIYQEIIKLASRSIDEFGKEGDKDILDEFNKSPAKYNCVSMEDERDITFTVLESDGFKMAKASANRNEGNFEFYGNQIKGIMEQRIIELYENQKNGLCEISFDNYKELDVIFSGTMETFTQIMAKLDDDKGINPESQKEIDELINNKMAPRYECMNLKREKDEFIASLKTNIPKLTPQLRKSDPDKYREINLEAKYRFNNYYGKVYADVKSGKCKKPCKKRSIKRE